MSTSSSRSAGIWRVRSGIASVVLSAMACEPSSQTGGVAAPPTVVTNRAIAKEEAIVERPAAPNAKGEVTLAQGRTVELWLAGRSDKQLTLYVKPTSGKGLKPKDITLQVWDKDGQSIELPDLGVPEDVGILAYGHSFHLNYLSFYYLNATTSALPVKVDIAILGEHRTVVLSNVLPN